MMHLEHQAELRGQHAGKERRKPPYPSSVLYLVDPQLHGHVEAVQDVSTEYQRVYRGVDGMDPTWGGGHREGEPLAPLGSLTYAGVQEGTGGPGEHQAGSEEAQAALRRGLRPSWPRGLDLQPWWTEAGNDTCSASRGQQQTSPTSRALMTKASCC